MALSKPESVQQKNPQVQQQDLVTQGYSPGDFRNLSGGTSGSTGGGGSSGPDGNRDALGYMTDFRTDIEPESRFSFGPTQEVSQAGQLKSSLQQSMLDATETGPKSIDEFYNESPYLQGIVDRTDDMLEGIDAAIAGITADAEEGAFDTDALIGQLNDSFEATKNQVLDSALASSQRASLELDAYLGSSTSDARSVVRRNMASSINNNLIRQTQQGISAMYSGHIDKVINTTLAGAQINAAVKRDATAALVNLTQSAAQLMLGTNSAVVDSYVKTLSVSNDLLKAF